jgi:hypothetical protein
MGRGLEILTIDASKLKMPFRSRVAPVVESPLASLNKLVEAEKHEWAPAAEGKFTNIEVRVEAVVSQAGDMSRVWEISGWLVPSGYSIFGMALALSNLLLPQAAGATCVGVSPILMFCLVAHATMVASWAGLGLILCAWALPGVCTAWQLQAGVFYVCMLGILVAASSPQARVVTWSCLVCLIISLGFTVFLAFKEVDQRWGMTVAGFFLVVMCVAATRYMGRVVYKVKQLQ